MRDLVPLRVPAGWLVQHNTFVEFLADHPPTADDYLSYCTEDLLQMRSCKLFDGAWHVDPEGFVVDLGWYPDGEPSGTYRLIVVRPDLCGETVLEFSHRNQRAICEAIETCTARITSGVAILTVAEEVRRIVSR
jgi:uncharacterized protein YoaH (UPF0181 family)